MLCTKLTDQCLPRTLRRPGWSESAVVWRGWDRGRGRVEVTRKDARRQLRLQPPRRSPSPGGPLFAVTSGDGNDASIQRFDLHHSVVVVAADPERHRRRRVVDRTPCAYWCRTASDIARSGRSSDRAHDAVGAHGRGPDLAVLVELGAVREGVSGGSVYSVNFSVFGSNTATLLPRYSVTRMRSWSSISMRRARACGGRRRVPRHLQRLGVDLAEMAFVEFGHPQIVLGIRHDLIDAVVVARRQRVGRMEFLPFAGRQIERGRCPGCRRSWSTPCRRRRGAGRRS